MRIMTGLVLFFCVVPLARREAKADEERSIPSLSHRIARWTRPSIGNDERALNELVSQRQVAMIKKGPTPIGHHPPPWRIRHAIAFAALLIGANGASAQTSPEYDFNRDIRPLLSGKCFQCHGPDAAAREANLRLDRRDAAIDSGGMVPGAPNESELINRISSHDPDTRMPPKGGPLSAKQIEKLTAWIKDGAKYDAHWSFQPPKLPSQPVVRDRSWPASEQKSLVLS